MRLLKNLSGALIEIIYPKTCQVCKKKITLSSIEGMVCCECWGKIKKNLPPFCRKCGRSLEKGKSIKNPCSTCAKTDLYFNRAFSPFSYEGVLKELIHSFKYKSCDYLGPVLAKSMIEFINEYNLPMQAVDLILPVPLHKAKLREREFNQSAILAKQLADKFDKDMPEGLLRRKLNTPSQTELDDSQRQLNVKGAFSVSDASLVKNKNILLVDDVLSTAATCSEASKALKESGAGMVYVITLAN